MIYVTRSQIASARALIRLWGEDEVDPVIVRIANAKPNPKRLISEDGRRRKAS